MKKRKRASASTLFLMELIIAVMFFALAATVCIYVFVHAHVLSRDAKRLNMAVNLTSDAAEIIRSQGSISGVRSFFVRSYRNAQISGPDSSCDIEVYFDDHFREIDGNHAVFTEKIHLELADSLLRIAIVFNNSDGNTIYSIEFCHDLLQRGGSA